MLRGGFSDSMIIFDVFSTMDGTKVRIGHCLAPDDEHMRIEEFFYIRLNGDVETPVRWHSEYSPDFAKSVWNEFVNGGSKYSMPWKRVNE